MDTNGREREKSFLPLSPNESKERPKVGRPFSAADEKRNYPKSLVTSVEAEDR